MHQSGSGTTPPHRPGPSPVLPTKEGKTENSVSDTGIRPVIPSAGFSPVDGFKTIRSFQSSKLLNVTVNPTTHDLSRNDSYPMDKLLAKLSEQQAKLKQKPDSPKYSDTESPRMSACEDLASSTSMPTTPTVHTLSTTDAELRPASATLQQQNTEADEVLRLKLQLVQAQNKISKLDQELAHSRTSRPSSAGQKIAPSRGLAAQSSRDSPWNLTDDANSDTSETFSNSGLAKRRAIWGNPKASFSGTALHTPAAEPSPSTWLDGRMLGPGYMEHPYSTSEVHRNDSMNPEADLLMRSSANRRNTRLDSRMGGGHQQLGPTFSGPTSPFDPMIASISAANMGMPPNHGSMGISMFPQYQQQPIGTPLSPHASEFTSKGNWKSENTLSDSHTYLPPTEPLNYRRLLDRNVNCNWKYIVDKIVCNNDQQASIFLQQKLKVGTPEQKYEIVEAIVAQAYPLMVNRFGNFLVQRCFEHGTPEQVIKIAEAIRGNTLNLSMDPFGCHVVQKAFDSVPEDYKAIMVRELLRRIPETVIHRYACHVWQKLFELRWTESPPQIMQFVNDALRGMWHEVALGETGSLVVQNIFENCLEDDKRPCIEEVLANIDIVAHGQFGNWCIQHICEHGSPPDRSRAIDHVIRYAAEYSTDQFASKVVEKCLKIGGSDFLGRYLDRVCEGRRDRTRIPLIDIASDQYGNYLVQWILDNATPQHREVVAAHIRKHMVSLRGSKFGSRVGMLCTNHAVTTRPGHGAGPSIPGRLPGGRYGTNAYR